MRTDQSKVNSLNCSQTNFNVQCHTHIHFFALITTGLLTHTNFFRSARAVNRKHFVIGQKLPHEMQNFIAAAKCMRTVTENVRFSAVTWFLRWYSHKETCCVHQCFAYKFWHEGVSGLNHIAARIEDVAIVAKSAIAVNFLFLMRPGHFAC